MGRFATGSRHLGILPELVKVLRETPGPQRTMAWNPVDGGTDGMIMSDGEQAFFFFGGALDNDSHFDTFRASRAGGGSRK